MNALIQSIRGLVLSLLLAASSLSAQAGAYDDLIAAAYRDDTAAVVDLLQRGMDVNSVDPAGNTLLHVATRNGNLELIEALLKRKANPTARNRVGDTPLMLAAYNGKPQAVDKLLAGGAQLNHSGWTPLHYAVFSGQEAITRHLIDKGASIDARAPNEQTPLMIAAGNGHTAVVKMLLKAKADPALKEQHGETALDLARKAGNSEIVKLLEHPNPSAGIVEAEQAKVAARDTPAKSEEYVPPPFQTEKPADAKP